MPIPGLDCEIVLDGTGYFLQPTSYLMRQPRLSRASYRADGSLAYIDLGSGKRSWSMTVLACNDLVRYDGTLTGMSGQQYRDALRASDLTTPGTTLSDSDPLAGVPLLVHFIHYEERILDLHSQLLALASGGPSTASYVIAIELLEV